MEDVFEKKLESDIKREFQLERMILFSDAVFAIVITLMAIDIKIPESEHKYTQEEFMHHLKLLLPNVIAYIVSFFFIGITWYRHLQTFGKIKDYDKGLVICNLVMLFCIGLFPFGASLVSHPGIIVTPYIIYFIIIILVAGSQVALQYYTHLKSATLLHTPPTRQEQEKLKVGIVVYLLFVCCMLTSIILFTQIENPEAKPLAMAVLFAVPIGKKIAERVIKKKGEAAQ